MHSDIVAVFGTLGHPYAADVCTCITVVSHTRFTDVISCIRQAGDQHAAGKGKDGMRPNYAAGVSDKGVYRFHQFGCARICGDIKDEDLIVVQTRYPQMTSVVRKPAVMGFVPTTYGNAGKYFSVFVFTARVNADGYELIGAIADAFCPQRSNIDIIFMTRHFGHIRRLAGLICKGEKWEANYTGKSAGQYL